MKKYIAILSLLAIFTAACTEESTWAPGEPDAAGSVGVYFDSNNPTDLVLVPGESTDILITMHREVTDPAIEVPIVATCNVPGLTFPASVHFDAGQADASFAIDCSGLEPKVTAKYHLSVPDEYLFIYNSSRYNSHDGSVLVSAWESANADGSKVKFIFTTNDYVQYAGSEPESALYAPYESEMEILPGANMYRIHDFMGSGNTFEFSLTESPFPAYSGCYRIVPAEEYCYDPEYGESYYNMWYLCGDVEDYPTYYVKDLKGNDTSFLYPAFYYYSSSYSMECCYMRPAGVADSEGVTYKKCAASMWLNMTPESGACPTYFYVYFQWDNMA